MRAYVTHFCLIAQKKDDPGSYGIEMPIGGQPIGLYFVGEQMAVAVVCPPNGVRVWHPVHVMPPGETMKLPIGADIAMPPIGTFVLGVGNNGAPHIVTVFRDKNWPTSALAGPVAGNG
ncbi:MAG: hypothetical protein KKA05_10470 [Alphaproteobacteria bacterium]|nr:hypothetical protein [Alphaproteobacteria bacterium]